MICPQRPTPKIGRLKPGWKLVRRKLSITNPAGPRSTRLRRGPNVIGVHLADTLTPSKRVGRERGEEVCQEAEAEGIWQTGLPSATECRRGCGESEPVGRVYNGEPIARESVPWIGDSGGPLTLQDGRGRSTLVGIIAGAVNCSAAFPSVYTSVAFHLRWIKDMLNDPSSWRSLEFY
ncbi:hypothetical protein MRX96_056340 [Rhipicephalus microplus]